MQSLINKQQAATILIVEDDLDIQNNIKDIIHATEFILDDVHYDISTLVASDGQIALDLLETHTPDLIISDIMMPRLSGIQFLEKIQSDAKWIRIPFIFLTAKDSIQDHHQGMLMGASLYLTKPFEIDTLVAHIKTQLKRTFDLQAVQETYVSSFKRQILKILNHEFRTPLTYVTAYYEILAEKASSPEQLNDYQDYLRGIQVGCVRLSKIVEDFNLIMSLNSGELHEKYHSEADMITNLPEIINTAVQKHQAIIQKGTVQLTLQIPEHLPAVVGVSHYFVDILSRLLDNAIKFSTDNDQLAQITIDAQIINDEVMITVNDNGIGLPGHVADTVFDLFYQFNRERKEQQGTGIGLYITKQLVELSGGRIDLFSAEGEGTTCRVHFPISKNNDSLMARAGRKAATVLIVEDDLNLLDGLQDLLEAFESQYVLEVLTAVNGREALSILETTIPNLIISDIMMPQMSGYDLLQTVRSRPEWLHIRFVFLTAIGSPPDKHKAYIMGVDEYVTKPYESDQLLETVEAQLDRQRLMQKMLNQDFDALKNSILHFVTPDFQQRLTFVTESIQRMNNIDEMDSFQASLQNIQEGSEWLRRLIEDFMTLAEFKTEEANHAFAYHAHIIPNITVLLAEFTQLHAAKLNEQEISLTFHANNADSAAILGDVAQISTCLRRLIEVGVHYSLQTDAPRIATLSSYQNEQSIYIELGFHGNLSPETAEFITQLLSSNKTKPELFRTFEFATDLAIVQGYMSLHHGVASLQIPSADQFLFRLEIPIMPETTRQA